MTFEESFRFRHALYLNWLFSILSFSDSLNDCDDEDNDEDNDHDNDDDNDDDHDEQDFGMTCPERMRLLVESVRQTILRVWPSTRAFMRAFRAHQ